jgi:class 3 adenylate cyclase
MPCAIHGDSMSVTASVEIEDLFRVNRDRLERVLAIGRVVLFAASTLLTIIIHSIFFAGGSWAPTLFFSALTVYALVVVVIVKKTGSTPPVIFGTLLFDLAFIGAIADVFTIFGTEGSRDGNLALRSMLTGPSILAVLAVHALRNHRGSSVVGVVMTPIVFIAVTLRPGAATHLVWAAAGITTLTGILLLVGTEETRRLLQAFARMQLLRRFLPTAAVERVLSADPDVATAPGGDLCTVTIVSTDLRGFTALSERLSPRGVVEQLNAYHATMLHEIESHGGALDKFIGDGALIVFGLDKQMSTATAARAAVACVASMRKALARLNTERERAGHAPLAMGIGVHTGAVIAGNIGAGRRLEFTVIGDAVNTAARLEGATKDLGTNALISGETASLLDGDPRLRALAPMPVRGKAEPVTVYALDE